jgi:hypothetical protein
MAMLSVCFGIANLPFWTVLLGVCGLLQAVMLAVANRRSVSRDELAWIILAGAPAIPLGQLLTGHLLGGAAGETALRAALGIILCAAGVFHLAVRPRTIGIPPFLRVPILLAAGCVHGGFASGGTLLVPYARFRLSERDAFRGTLSVAWVVFNLVLLAGAIQPARMLVTGQSLLVVSSCLLVAVASWAGDRLARRFNQQRFAQVVAGMMVLGGVLYLWRLF